MIIKTKNPEYACILTTGRTGSDYLQSCLDSVPGILTMTGQTYFKKFFIQSNFENIKHSKKKVIDQFVKIYQNLFKKDMLENKKINLDTRKFKEIFLIHSENKNLEKKNFIELIFLSFEILTRNKYSQVKTVVNHCHSVEEMVFFLDIFPSAKILVTIRNPIQNLFSGINNWKKFSKIDLGQKHNYFYTKRILYDLRYALKLNNRVHYVKLENCFKKQQKKNLLRFLNVKYSTIANKATCNGKPWIGDRLSQNRTTDGSFNVKALEKSNEYYFNAKDEFVLSYFYRTYQKFGYFNKKKGSFYHMIKYFFSAISPLSFEKKTIMEQPFKLKNYYYYLQRVLLFIIEL